MPRLYSQEQYSDITTYYICNDSPTVRHYWIINDYNIGVCKYCNTEKAFTSKIMFMERGKEIRAIQLARKKYTKELKTLASGLLEEVKEK